MNILLAQKYLNCGNQLNRKKIDSYYLIIKSELGKMHFILTGVLRYVFNIRVHKNEFRSILNWITLQ